MLITLNLLNWLYKPSISLTKFVFLNLFNEYEMLKKKQKPPSVIVDLSIFTKILSGSALYMF